MKSYRLVKPYFKEKLFLVIFGIVCLITVDMLQLFIPRIIKQAVDDLAIFHIDTGRLLEYALSIVGIALAIAVLRYAWRRCLIGTSRRVEEGLRNQLFAHIQTLSAPYFDDKSTGDLMAHATNDLNHIRMATGMGLVALTDALFLGTAAIGFMAYIDVRLPYSFYDRFDITRPIGIPSVAMKIRYCIFLCQLCEIRFFKFHSVFFVHVPHLESK